MRTRFIQRSPARFVSVDAPIPEPPALPAIGSHVRGAARMAVPSGIAVPA